MARSARCVAVCAAPAAHSLLPIGGRVSSQLRISAERARLRAAMRRIGHVRQPLGHRCIVTGIGQRRLVADARRNIVPVVGEIEHGCK